MNITVVDNQIMDTLSIAEKICLFNALYRDLANRGLDGDTELAHVNAAEMEVLRNMGGSGTINPITGLRQFGGGGSPPPPPPSTQTVTQQQTIPDELKPYITDILSKSQAIQEKRTQEGYQPYPGQQIASFTPEQQQAFQGAANIQGLGTQYFDPAAQLAASSAMAPTAGAVSQYMSPYMQNVVDIQQREAMRQADVANQQLAARAVGAGGFGGSRQAILEAEQQRNLQQQLGDIQAKGLASAYEDAQNRLAAQRQRELAAGQQFTSLGQLVPQQRLQELSALEAVGAQKQAQSQQAINLAQQQYEAEQTFPERTLQQYSSIIRGYNLPPSTQAQTVATTPAPSYLQQAAGLGMLGAGLFGAFKAKGGQIKSNNDNVGLSSLKAVASKTIRRQDGGGLTQFELLRQMSDQELMGALKNPKFSPTIVNQVINERPKFRFYPDSSLLLGNSKSRALAAERLALSNTGRASAGEIDFSQYIPKKIGPEDFVPEPLSNTGGASAGEIDFSQYIPKEVGPEDFVPEPLRNTGWASAGEIDFSQYIPKEVGPEDEPPSRRQQVVKPISGQVYEEALGTEPKFGSGKVSTSPVTKTDKGQVVATNPFSEYDSQFESGEQLISELKSLSEKKKGLLEDQKKGLSSDRWMELANLGFNVLSQPGGQTFLQALGKGGKESNILGNLSKLNKEERQIAMNLAETDVDTLTKVYGIERDMAQQVRENVKLDLLGQELDIKIATAKTDQERKRFQNLKDVLEMQKSRQEMQGSKAPALTKEESEDFTKAIQKYKQTNVYDPGIIFGDTNKKAEYPREVSLVLSKMGLTKIADQQKYIDKALEDPNFVLAVKNQYRVLRSSQPTNADPLSTAIAKVLPVKRIFLN